MPMNACTAIDSNCLTYLVDAITVQSEYQKIKDASSKERHEEISNIVLGDVPKSNPISNQTWWIWKT